MTKRDVTITPLFFITARSGGATLKELTDPICIKMRAGKIHPLEMARSLSGQSGCKVTVKYFIVPDWDVRIDAETWFDLAFQLYERYGFILYVKECSETGQIRAVFLCQIVSTLLPEPKAWVSHCFCEPCVTESDR